MLNSRAAYDSEFEAARFKRFSSFSVIPKTGRKAQELEPWMARRLIGQLNRTTSVQIALRLPEPDVTRAREIATRKAVGYQTLLKILVHEGLRREARRS